EELVQYVQHALLRQLPGHIREFMLATTACVWLDADLAQRLSGFSNASALLEECVSRGLFLERYRGPNAETMYRWYTPVASLCQILLRRHEPDRAKKLYRCAAIALKHTYPAEAIHHAIEARDPQTCSEIIR